ncbi:MAG TPA: hypothetical protein VFT69_10165 [Pseudolabrys sp.]|nr:hypothetical protein [Pseudolabrys sp.]
MQIVSPGADRQVNPFDSEALASGRRLHDLHALGGDFGPDIVAEQNSDLHTAPLTIEATKPSAATVANATVLAADEARRVQVMK